MFGNHDYDVAVKIAAEKSKELNKECTVIPCGNEAPGKYTIGVPIKVMSGTEFEQHLLGKLGKKR